jgi:hypothetical protein
MKNMKNTKHPVGQQCTHGGSIFENVFLDTAKEMEINTLKSHLDKQNTIKHESRTMIHPGHTGSSPMTQAFLEHPTATRSSQGMSLTGEQIDIENFTHNNMVPFFGGSIKQNVNENASATRLELFTGNSSLDIPKEELSPMFSSQQTNIYGQPTRSDDLSQRYNASNKQQGVPLTQPTRVGPGLGQGFTTEGSGGFHEDIESRQYYIPKTTNELRASNKPKETYDGRFNPGFCGTRRGLQSKVEQNRVIRFHSFDQPRFNTTVVTQKKTLRPEISARDTRRQNTSTAYSGTAGPSVVKKPENYSSYSPEVVHRQHLESSGPRNAVSTGAKETSVKYCTDIRNAQKEVSNDYIGLASSAVKRIIAPVQDILKTTVRETTEDHGRPEGHVGGIATQLTMHDPDDIARTTIKETTVHDDRIGNVGSIGQRGSTYIQDLPQTTNRETLKNFITSGNLNGNKRVSRPDTKAIKTVRETTLHTPAIGQASIGQVGQGYITNPKEAPNVARQFISDNEYTGQAQGDGLGAYTVTDTFAPPTSRQFTADNEYTGVAEGEVKPMSYTDIYNATINTVRQDVAKGRNPTKTGVKIASGQAEIGQVLQKVPLAEPDALQKTKLTQLPPNKNEQGITTQKNSVCDASITQRIEPDTLAAFKENPFTQSLSSTA